MKTISKKFVYVCFWTMLIFIWIVTQVVCMAGNAIAQNFDLFIWRSNVEI